jgi:hypothetical protein
MTIAVYLMSLVHGKAPRIPTLGLYVTLIFHSESPYRNRNHDLNSDGLLGTDMNHIIPHPGIQL